MPYVDQATMTSLFGQKELIQLTDRVQAGTIQADVLDAAISNADQIINIRLAGRYETPFSDMPATPLPLVGIAADIARWHLYDDEIPPAVQKRYDDALARLDALASGEALLDPSLLLETGRQTPVVIAPTAVFDDDTLALVPDRSSPLPW